MPVAPMMPGSRPGTTSSGGAAPRGAPRRGVGNPDVLAVTRRLGLRPLSPSPRPPPPERRLDRESAFTAEHRQHSAGRRPCRSSRSRSASRNRRPGRGLGRSPGQAGARRGRRIAEAEIAQCLRSEFLRQGRFERRKRVEEAGRCFEPRLVEFAVDLQLERPRRRRAPHPHPPVASKSMNASSDAECAPAPREQALDTVLGNVRLGDRVLGERVATARRAASRASARRPRRRRSCARPRPGADHEEALRDRGRDSALVARIATPAWSVSRRRPDRARRTPRHPPDRRPRAGTPARRPSLAGDHASATSPPSQAEAPASRTAPDAPREALAISWERAGQALGDGVAASYCRSPGRLGVDVGECIARDELDRVVVRRASSPAGNWQGKSGTSANQTIAATAATATTAAIRRRLVQREAKPERLEAARRASPAMPLEPRPRT